MNRTLTILALVAGLGTGLGAGGARADDDCFAPMADWQPRAAVTRLAETRGWTLHRIKIDDGCYELDATDAAGRQIEVTLDPATLAVIELELEDDDDDDDHRRGRGIPD